MDRQHGRLHLYQSVIILNIVYLLCGTTYAWSSPVLMKLSLTEAEGTTVASMLSLGSVFGPIVSGALLDVVGRKGTVGLAMALMTASWLILTLSTSFSSLCVGRFFGGITSGIAFSAVPMYIAEISEDSVRGILNTLSQIFCCSGSLIVYSVGPFVSYDNLHYVGLGLCTTFFVLFPLLPNSPYALVMKNNIDQAKKTLVWLRGNQSESSVEKEFQLVQKNIRETQNEKGAIKDLFTSDGNRRALLICVGLIVLQQFTGVTVIFFYAEKIFHLTGSDIDSRLCCIVIGVIMLITSFICPVAVKYHGYKKPLLLSAGGMALGMGGLGTFFLLKFNNFEVDSIGWLPLLSIILFITFFNSGFSNIPWALAGELFPSNIKAYATTVVATSCGIFAFTTTFLFSHLKDLIGLEFLFMSCSFSCCVAIVFITLLMQDTSGLSFIEIQDILNGKKRKDLTLSIIIKEKLDGGAN